MIKTETLMKKITDMGFHAYNHEGDGSILTVSAEHGDDAADYYGEFRGGYPWINPKLEELANKHKCFWEWINPGIIGLYKI